MDKYLHAKKGWGADTYADTIVPLAFGKGYVISTHTLLGMWLLIRAGVKVYQF